MNIINRVTLKGLIKNKIRTIVTIIGVVLSAAMITAVTTFINSLQSYAVEYTKVSEGDWHGVIYNLSQKDYKDLINNDQLETVLFTKSGGHAFMEDSINENKPYLHLLELDEKALTTLPVHLISGRLPQNENEVLISEHTYSNGGVLYQAGDIITLELGQRIMPDGTLLGDNEGYFKDEAGNTEELKPVETRTFTVVGICNRLSYKIEYFSAPGYTVVTKINPENISNTDKINVYMKAKKAKDIYNIIENYLEVNGSYPYEFNYDLLRYLNASNEDSFNRVLYSLGSILIFLIMVGSISLIYNSFAISVSERKKQFGLLSSVGATAKQRRNSVLFESIVIAGVGIPVGVLSGIAGISVTLYLLKEQLTSVLQTELPVQFAVRVSPVSIITAVAVALITILISAYIPARRSKRVSALDAIRQTEDIKLTARKVKTSRLTRKIFGLEGDLALKNLKRNRRRYRSTVISLFVSVVLFISASAFAMYLKDSVGSIYENTDYDLSYYLNADYFTDEKIKEVYNEIRSLEDIMQSAVIRPLYGTITLSKDQVTTAHYESMLNRGVVEEGKGLEVNLTIYSVDHAAFMEYLNESGLEKEQFISPQSPSGIVIDNQHFYSPVEKRFKNTKLLANYDIKTMPFKAYTEDEIDPSFDLRIGAFANDAPFGINEFSYENSLIYIIDEQVKDVMLKGLEKEWSNVNMLFAADNPGKSEDDIINILKQQKMPYQNLFNEAENLQDNRNIITIISVFAYGFITLISLITIANVFNTVSTNMNLRRREFAMLKSVGMTSRSFNKMLNYECIFYGLKALLYGLPVSAFFTYLIYKSVENGLDTAFYLPVHSILISILSVFLVVFISMMYSMSKIRHENVLDALKNENL